jgi:hypothetical protein
MKAELWWVWPNDLSVQHAILGDPERNPGAAATALCGHTFTPRRMPHTWVAPNRGADYKPECPRCREVIAAVRAATDR